MLRDIREGEIYERSDMNGYVVQMVGGSLKFGLGEDDADYAYLTRPFLAHTWRKRPALVDFATAFAAFESGKLIRPESVEGWCYSPRNVELVSFRAKDVRGKWVIVEDEGGDAN